MILSWNTRELTRGCLRSLKADPTPNEREIIVVENASEDGSAEMIAAEFPDVILLRNGVNRLYAEGNNQGARAATKRFLCLLNSDTEVHPGALDYLVDFLDRNPEYGAAAPQLLNGDESVQQGCSRFPTLVDPLIDSTLLGQVWPGTRLAQRTRMGDFDHRTSRDVDQPPASCLVLERKEYLRLDGLDPDLSLYFNDVDLCRRIWKSGRRIRYLAEAKVFHHHGASTRKNIRGMTLWSRNREAFYRKHFGIVGAVWLRFVFYVASAQMWLGIHLGPKDAPARRAALEDLRMFMRDVRRT